MEQLISQIGQEINSLVKNGTQVKLAKRISIVILKSIGFSMKFISKKINYSRQSISKWLKRYEQYGIAGLEDLNRIGRPKKISDCLVKKIEKQILNISQSKKNMLCASGEYILNKFIGKLSNTISRSSKYRILKRRGFKKLIPRPMHINKSDSTCNTWLKNIKPNIYRLKKHYPKKEIEIYFQDETRYGQQTSKYKIWAKKGSNLTYKKQSGFLNSWIYGAVSSQSGKKFGLILPKLDSENMQLFLNKFSKRIHYKKMALLILDGSSAHKNRILKIPKNIILHFLPPYSPELNPIERLWLYIKKNYLSFKIYKSIDEINKIGAAAWNKIDAKTIQSLCNCNYL